MLKEAFSVIQHSIAAFVPPHSKIITPSCGTRLDSYQREMTHQYGVPMKESLLCNVLVFLADTPKSAESRNEL